MRGWSSGRTGCTPSPAGLPGGGGSLVQGHAGLPYHPGRGLGIGDRLVGAVVDFARGAGYRELVLWTNDVLASARRVHQRHGFVLAAEKPHRSFGQDLNGQDWRLDLHGTQE